MLSFVTAATGNEFSKGALVIHISQLPGASSRTERVKDAAEGVNGIRTDVNI